MVTDKDILCQELRLFNFCLITTVSIQLRSYLKFPSLSEIEVHNPRRYLSSFNLGPIIVYLGVVRKGFGT